MFLVMVLLPLAALWVGNTTLAVLLVIGYLLAVAVIWLYILYDFCCPICGGQLGISLWVQFCPRCGTRLSY